MALKNYNPVTAGQRQLVLIDRTGLYTGKPIKALTEGKNATGGRNNSGSITSRYRGGGHKKAYRIIDFKRRKFDAPAKVERLEYDPNRTSFIALIKYPDGELSYILRRSGCRPAIRWLRANMSTSSPAMPCRSPTSRSAPSSTISVEIGKGGQIARSAGTYAQIVGRDGEYVILRPIPASSGWCTGAASRLSARCRTPTT